MDKIKILKKRTFLLFLFSIIFFNFFYLVLANTNQTGNATSSQQLSTNKTKIDLAYECLQNELKADCSGATTTQQLAFSILAAPNNTQECVRKLESKAKSEGCFGDSGCNVRDTALAIIALDFVNKNTSKYVDWLIKQNRSSSEVEWILQQDSDGETNCKLKYEGNDYLFIAKENKKLSGNFGPCFSLTYNDYWLKLNSDCYNKEFFVTCDKKFYLSWIFRSSGSSEINVLSDTKEGAQNSEIKTSINSLCFGSGNFGCNYEETVWAVLALKKLGKNIKPFVPYIISSEETNKQYLPEAFSYLILEYDNLYAQKLIKMQKDEKYWEAENSVYGRYYDTALVLLAFGNINQKQILDARKWTEFVQDSSGCWNSKNIRDTAFLLWALERREAPRLIEVTPRTKCSQAPVGATCSRETDCINAGGETLRNYDCSGESTISFAICCNKNPSVLKTCEQMDGKKCPSGKVCEGVEKNASDGKCCIGDCIEQQPQPKRSDCEIAGGICRTSCKTGETAIDEECSDSSKCCKREEKKDSEEKKVPLWVWLLVGIVLVLIILVILLRERIKVYLFKKKDSSNKPFGGISSSPFGPKPGFPPINPQMSTQQRPLPSFSSQRPPLHQNQQEVFKRLKEMSK